ncbi:MAG TPA: hypothetical protein IAA29_11640 [Candidatus Paenibacillus intestinavium]|nr:hypothetical protein [Candidatus Paenibacillus intestinavium]
MYSIGKISGKVSIVVLLLVSMLMLGERKATYACDCVIPGSFSEGLEKYDIVFEGVVIDTDKNKDTLLGKKSIVNSAEPVEWTFQVIGAWKGEVTEEIVVVSKSHSASCGYEFEVGKRYAVFATSNDDNITVSSCSGTRSIADNSKIFEELGEYTITLTSVTDKVDSTDAERTTQIDPPEHYGSTSKNSIEPANTIEKPNQTGIKVFVIVLFVVLLCSVLVGILILRKIRK